MKCVITFVTSSPPRALFIAVRSSAAQNALRTLTFENGPCLLLTAM